MRFLTLTIITSLILSGCSSSVSVTTDYDKSVDFSQHKTLQYYGWAENSDKILNSIQKNRIEKAVAYQFERRGITVVEGDADIIVSLFIVTEKRKQVIANTTSTGGTYGGYGGYYNHGPAWGWGGGYSTTTYNEYEYTVGTLAISVYDAVKKELIWEGIGEGTIDDNQKKIEEKINRSISKIMYSYPTKVLKK